MEQTKKTQHVLSTSSSLVILTLLSPLSLAADYPPPPGVYRPQLQTETAAMPSTRQTIRQATNQHFRQSQKPIIRKQPEEIYTEQIYQDFYPQRQYVGSIEPSYGFITQPVYPAQQNAPGGAYYPTAPTHVMNRFFPGMPGLMGETTGVPYGNGYSGYGFNMGYDPGYIADYGNRYGYSDAFDAGYGYTPPPVSYGNGYSPGYDASPGYAETFPGVYPGTYPESYPSTYLNTGISNPGQPPSRLSHQQPAFNNAIGSFAPSSSARPYTGITGASADSRFRPPSDVGTR